MRPRIEATCKDCGAKIPNRLQPRKDATCFSCKYKSKSKPKGQPIPRSAA